MKILVVRFSSIGDVVLTTPVVRCLKQQVKDARIHFITKKAFQSVLDQNPYIDRIITIEKSVDEVVELLKNEQYDYVIDLHNNIRTLRLKRALKVRSFAFPKKNFSKLLLTTFKINRMPDLHVVDRYFEAVKGLGVVNDHKPCDFFLSDADIVDLEAIALAPKKFIGVAMGAQYATKQMPVSLMAKILEGVHVPVVLLGGPMDSERAAELIEQLPNQRVLDLCGKLTLRQSAFMTKQCAKLLTGDTGLMHIASCFETPIVSVWGNTVPDFGMYTYAPQNKSLYTIHEVEGLSCRPCSKIGYKECPKKHFKCMHLQDSEKIKLDLMK
ncbi:glycosyltransferase family 9 protein [Fluviicola chungangensis]|uniref:Glycosyltransferase family 9 protein n=1 Tax=Fluviicola chungangensis TaxID=2597671 RepID=A0A556MJE8_9FLAO|nr:glycosyltransferase family 9 protein [Fluviicola chungangensis]TSJ39993.1 glycosyltransferase family 9 protein [Fluviicola chungangensis]